MKRSAFRPSGGAVDPMDTLLVRDDPKLVKGALARSPNLKQGLVASEDAQAAFLGGDEAVELLMREVRTVDDEDVDLFASTFGAIRAPSVKKWLASKAKVSRLAAAMLELHG